MNQSDQQPPAAAANDYLPDSVKVGWMVFRIIRATEQESAENGFLGRIVYDRQLIKIATHLSPMAQAEVLLHELLHAIMHLWSISVPDVGQSDNPEETLVAKLSHALTTVLADNPQLLQCLGATMGGDGDG